LFTEFDADECLLDMEAMSSFFKVFTAEMDLTFYGVDIIVSNGVHYLVDCNYLSNYEKIPM